MVRVYYHPTPNPAKIARFLEDTGLTGELVPAGIQGQFDPRFLAVNGPDTGGTALAVLACVTAAPKAL